MPSKSLLKPSLYATFRWAQCSLQLTLSFGPISRARGMVAEDKDLALQIRNRYARRWPDADMCNDQGLSCYCCAQIGDAGAGEVINGGVVRAEKTRIDLCLPTISLKMVQVTPDAPLTATASSKMGHRKKEKFISLTHLVGLDIITPKR